MLLMNRQYENFTNFEDDGASERVSQVLVNQSPTGTSMKTLRCGDLCSLQTLSP